MHCLQGELDEARDQVHDLMAPSTSRSSRETLTRMMTFNEAFQDVESVGVMDVSPCLSSAYVGLT